MTEENKVLLKIVSEMTGKSEDVLINEAVKHYYAMYNTDGSPIRKGVYKDSNSTENPCYILRPATVFGDPYYEIYDIKDGTHKKVPEALVKFV